MMMSSPIFSVMRSAANKHFVNIVSEPKHANKTARVLKKPAIEARASDTVFGIE